MRRFKSQWRNYELATDVATESQEKRTAILLSCVGSDAYDVFQTMVFHYEANRSNVEAVIKAFYDYCIGETNITYERYTLNKRVQESSESFDNFLMELSRLVKSCEYGELEESILKDRIVIGIRDDGTRRKLIQIHKLDLAAAIDVCRASETAMRHLREIRSVAEDVHSVGTSATASGRNRSPSRDRRHDERRRGDDDGSRGIRKCKFCGKGHPFKKELCPAYSRKCRKCDSLNHFESMCPNKMTNAKSSWRQECKQIDSDQDSDYENIFVVRSNKPQFKRKLFAYLKVGENLIRFQVDSGATVCILSEDLAKQALGENFTVRPADAVLRMFDNTVLKTVWMITTKGGNPKKRVGIQGVQRPMNNLWWISILLNRTSNLSWVSRPAS